MKSMAWQATPTPVLDLLPSLLTTKTNRPQQVAAGKLRLIAVTGDQRLPGFPDVPTVAEALPGYRMGSYFGVVGPGGMDPALARRISQDIGLALRSPQVSQQLQARGLVAVGSTPEAFERLVRSEISDMARLVEATGIRVD